MFLKKNLTAFLLFMIVLVAGQTILFNGIAVPVKINFILTVNMMLFAMTFLNHIRLQRDSQTTLSTNYTSQINCICWSGFNLFKTSESTGWLPNFINQHGFIFSLYLA